MRREVSKQERASADILRRALLGRQGENQGSGKRREGPCGLLEDGSMFLRQRKHWKEGEGGEENV